MYGVEVGYGFTLTRVVTLRPLFAIGNFTATTDSSGQDPITGNHLSSSSSRSNVYVEPGITALLLFGRWFVGADLNALILPGMANVSGGFSTHGQIGLVF